MTSGTHRGQIMTNRQGRTSVTLRQALASGDAARPAVVDRLESRVLLSGAPAASLTAPLAATQVMLTAPNPALTAHAQGQIAQELVPGGVILRSIGPALPRGSGTATGTATAPPRAAGAGLDIV